MGARIARKHVGWYLATLPGVSEFRRHFNTLEDPEAQVAAIRQFFAQRCEAFISGDRQGVAA